MPALTSLLRLLGAIAVLSSPAQSASNGQAQAPLTSGDFVCEHPSYGVHVVSKSPLIIYLTDFITPSERAHLREATYANLLLSPS